jgi:hypothetical protein
VGVPGVGCLVPYLERNVANCSTPFVPTPRAQT